MKVSATNQRALLLAMHQSIEEGAAYYAKNLLEGPLEEPSYPPNSGFTTEERKALLLLRGNQALHSALRKILASCAAGPVFDLLSHLDGATDPEHGNWSGMALVDREEGDTTEEEVLWHDNFYAAYWAWREVRPEKTWYLDTLPE